MSYWLRSERCKPEDWRKTHFYISKLKKSKQNKKWNSEARRYKSSIVWKCTYYRNSPCLPTARSFDELSHGRVKFRYAFLSFQKASCHFGLDLRPILCHVLFLSQLSPKLSFYVTRKLCSDREMSLFIFMKILNKSLSKYAIILSFIANVKGQETDNLSLNAIELLIFTSFSGKKMWQYLSKERMFICS